MFGGLNITGDHIYFFNAQEDPWQYAGLRHIKNPEEHKKQKAWLIECTDCAHCIDLHTPSASDPKSLKEGRAHAISTITEWLHKDVEKRAAQKVEVESDSDSESETQTFLQE